MRISKRAAIRTYHPNFVYCLETVTVRGVFELLYLGGLCPTPFSVYRYIYTSTAYRSIRILFVRWMFARSETWNNLRQINNITRIYINLYKNVEEWVKFENNFIIVSKLYLYNVDFFYFLYINNRCRLDLHGRHFVQRERHKMEDSRFSTFVFSFSLVKTDDDDDSDKGNFTLWWKRISRHPVFVEVHSVCPWRVVHSSSEATFAVPSSLLQPRLRVYSGETRTIFLSVQIQSILIYIYLFTFDMDTRNYRYSMKSLLKKRN